VAETSENKVDVLVLGPKNLIGVEVSKILNGYQPYNLVTYNSIENLLKSSEEEVNPQLALVSAAEDTNRTCEWVQSTKMTYPHVPIIVLHDSSAKLNHAKAEKNGARFIMHLFYDREFISDRILQLAPVDMDGDHIPLSALVAIHAEDFEPGTKIDFNLYVHLPSNQKTLMFRKAGSVLDEKAIAKIRTSQGQRVYVRKTQLPQFFKYASSVLKQRNQADVVCQTEKLQKAKNEIQTIMAYFLDEDDAGYEHGKKIIERCDAIINEFGLIQNMTSEQIFFKLVAHNGQEQTIYNDCVNLCAYATLFAKILDMDTNAARTAALAGILCTIGLANLPRELFLKPERMWNQKEKEAYTAYPADSVKLIKKNKVPLDPDIARIIEQHRERLDGSGFPFGHKGTQIHKMAKLLGVAYRFQQLTSLHGDRTALTPMLAIDQIMKENTATPGKMPYDTIMVTAIHAFIKINTQRLLNNKVA
jgi:HD-GYP domain-containing protein (c-di-GMP phosphodiesterase class II)